MSFLGVTYLVLSDSESLLFLLHAACGAQLQRGTVLRSPRTSIVALCLKVT